MYEVAYDHIAEKELRWMVASGKPYKGVSAEQAAKRLLRAVWYAEVERMEFDPSGVHVEQEGLLNQADIREIESTVGWFTRAPWLQTQSEESLAALRAYLPTRLDDHSLEAIEELESCVNDLGLPDDFLEICRLCDCSASNLDSLVALLLKDAVVIRERRAKVAAENVQRFRQEIDLLIREFNSESTRGGGMVVPSVQHRVKIFLERFVGTHGELPTGKHKVSDFFGPVVDFDQLRQKYGL